MSRTILRVIKAEVTNHTICIRSSFWFCKKLTIKLIRLSYLASLNIIIITVHKETIVCKELQVAILFIKSKVLLYHLLDNLWFIKYVIHTILQNFAHSVSLLLYILLQSTFNQDTSSSTNNGDSNLEFLYLSNFSTYSFRYY